MRKINGKTSRGLWIPSGIVALIACGTWGDARAGANASWSTPVEPFRIVSGIYYVGTQGLAAYLITSSQGAILLDGTTEQNAPLIERNIQKVGVALRDVKLIVSDHAHADHVGAVARIKRDTGARFVASAGDAWALRHGTARGDNTYAAIAFPPIEIDQVVQDGESVAIGEAVLTAHVTAGHTPGCTSWTMTAQEGERNFRVLFLCSLTVAGNVLVGNRSYPQIASDYEKTFATLAEMKADIVLTSHPEMADVLGREARRRAGHAQAFTDSPRLSDLVDEARQDFRTALADAQRGTP